jgi:cob(I)alamin adenosyltransferase
MKIYTKTGDKGQTSLIGGVRVPKHHIRIEAYGTLDELNSYMGYVHSCLTGHSRLVLQEIQDRLFTIGSHLASDPKSKMIVPDVHQKDIDLLENEIDKMNEALPPLKNFILPGGSRDVSVIHVARCVCRRAERLITQLSEEHTVDALILQYINRLSDYLFVLARKLALDTGVEESVWHPRG